MDDKCNANYSDVWHIPDLPTPIVKSAKVIVNVNKKYEPLQF
jgi:hypothetical protein